MSELVDIDNVSLPMSGQDARDKIQALENHWKTLPQVDIPVFHHWSGGIYAREIVIPADTFLTGRIYCDDHIDIMISGDITVSSDEGRKRLEGFHIFESNHGKKRAGYTHSETRWITIQKSPLMDDDEYLEALTAGSFDEYEDRHLSSQYIDESEIKHVFTAQSSYRQSDYEAFRIGYLAAKDKPSRLEAGRADYQLMLDDYGLTEELVRSQSENEDDQTHTQYDGVMVATSPIEGKGLFGSTFKAGEVIMPARVNGLRTISGRYTNHDIHPNAVMVANGGDVDLVALRDIKNEEITIDYRSSIELVKEAV